MSDMVHKDVLPAISACTGKLASDASSKLALGGIDISYEIAAVSRLSELMGMASKTVNALDSAVIESAGIASQEERSVFCRDRILATMNELRIYVDEMETMTSAEYWPYPSYGELLFSIR